MGEAVMAGAELGARVDAVADFARSALFERTFQDGMSLVEDTAAYLDGAGRQEARLLARSAALAYANASMRLTTQLMQVASWLLVQRAVREGDMAASEACDARYRLSAPVAEPLVADVPDDSPEEEAGLLPGGLTGLLERSQRLYERVSHLDRRMYCEATPEPDANPVTAQLQRLRAAFGG
jgi:regulator of CtrA degradation